MTVLVILETGCDVVGQQDIAAEAGNRLHFAFSSSEPRSIEWGRHHHHVCGLVESRERFERVRGLATFDGRSPTVRPIWNPGGGPCGGCDGTGRVPFARAEYPCPLCGGTGREGEDELDPSVFPMALFDPDFAPWAVVTPDGRWHQSRERDYWADAEWKEFLRATAEYYRHCYGVCMSVKT